MLIRPFHLPKVLLAATTAIFSFAWTAYAAGPAVSIASNPAPNGAIAVHEESDVTLTTALPQAMATAPASRHYLASASPIAAKVSTPPETSADSLDLLAQLDAELASAQSQLDGARQRLGDGQKQLQTMTNTMRTAMLSAGPEATGLHPFVRVASRYMGTPYVWGGESRYGFDCSGLIIRVMRDLGYKTLPHSAAEQFRYGTPIAKSLLKPGDLVFFANTYKPGISHVGIYIGDGRFIQAASTSKGTIVSRLSEAYYAKHYAGARRLATIK